MKRLLIVCMLATGFTVNAMPITSYTVPVEYMNAHQIKKAGNGGFIYIAEAEDRDEYLSNHPGSVYLGIAYVPSNWVLKRDPGPQ
ncbi:hypothetical protein [Pedobacter cryoconitis]|uniref:Uncharacterized protein n=1 Tax=Pedobacter cryoconitis TaxID=188932 RepID=A0A327S8S0_9SPHI|nr:hypothetical protein [Pedobacter cryoconitis]RAJ25366.1 hypothetical protein LY11_04101 [Pedobacter cryoconitis]